MQDDSETTWQEEPFEDVLGAINENAAAHEEATRRIIVSMMQQHMVGDDKMTWQEELYAAVSDTFDELIDAMIEYLVADKMITMQGDDIVKYSESERRN